MKNSLPITWTWVWFGNEKCQWLLLAFFGTIRFREKTKRGMCSSVCRSTRKSNLPKKKRNSLGVNSWKNLKIMDPLKSHHRFVGLLGNTKGPWWLQHGRQFSTVLFFFAHTKRAHPEKAVELSTKVMWFDWMCRICFGRCSTPPQLKTGIFTYMNAWFLW